jgi:cytoskeleton protein RodZ
METLGEWLRRTREAKGTTIEEVESHTRIRPRFLEALEAGDFGVFPGGEVQVRGFLRIYARYLGLSPDQVLAHYDKESRGIEIAPPAVPGEAQSASSDSSPAQPAQSQSLSVPAPTYQPRRTNLLTLIIVSVASIALITTVAVATIVTRGDDDRAPATPASTAVAESGSSSTATPTRSAPAVTPTFPVNPEGVVTLTLEATEHVWVHVMQDGQTVFRGLLASGQVETWSGQQVISVNTGNGAGLLVTVNGQPQGTMCGRAEVCTRAWGAIGEVVLP